MSSSEDRKDEDFELEGDSLCKVINISLGIRDTSDPIHDIPDAEHDIADAENNNPEFFEDPNSDAENDILVLDFGDIVFAEELGTRNFVSLSNMAFTEDTTNLLFLANVALGAYSQGGQQPAPVVPPQADFGGNTLRPGEQPVVSTPSGQAVARDRRSTPISRRPRPRTLPYPPSSQLTRPLLQPLHAPTPAPPIPSRKQRVKKSQKSKPRTTGFNQETGEGMLTSACGNRTPEIKEPVAGGSGKGKYRCPRCLGRFTRPRNIKDHFVSCVRKYGNPQGFHWFDHQSLAATKKWLLNRLPRARQEENVEREEGTDGQEEEEDEDKEEDSNLGEVNEDESRAYNISTRSGVRDHGPARFQIPSLSLREESRPERSRYPTLERSYRPQLHTSPYDSIVPGSPPSSLRQGSRPDHSRYARLEHGYGPQVQTSPYDPIVPRDPPPSLRQGFRPEVSRYPQLEHGYGHQLHASPYDPIVPGNRDPIRAGERATYEDEDEDERPTVVRNTKRTRRRPQTE